jgi:hypothetical protein
MIPRPDETAVASWRLFQTNAGRSPAEAEFNPPDQSGAREPSLAETAVASSEALRMTGPGRQKRGFGHRITFALRLAAGAGLFFGGNRSRPLRWSGQIG